jgi:hypothetical protein
MNQNNDMVTLDTFEALSDAVIPQSPGLAEEYGIVQFYGALDQATDEYMILNLVPFAEQTAETLTIVAGQLLSRFMAGDRLLIIDRLRQGRVNTTELPIPFRNNPQLVMSVTKSLVAAAMMGYYSEWFGYGTTRLDAPDNRRLEYYPISWEQIGYPGPSLGYRALREYKFT